MTDTYQHKGRRQKMIDSLISKGINDPYVLAAMNKIPRHFFMENFLDAQAYSDKAYPIGAGQTISQPYTVAYQTQLLALRKQEKVLEIGTGSGYQTAILVECKAKVFSIERHKSLYLRTKNLLQQLDIKAYLYHGDGHLGLPTFGPFDRILVTAAASEIPTQLLEQLNIGGYMIIPIGSGNQQTMSRITRLQTNEYQRENLGTFSFVPMLPGTEK